MIKTKQELKAANRLWESLNQLQDMLFEYYGNEFIDMHMDQEPEPSHIDDDWLY